MTLKDCIEYFQLAPCQVAHFLWMDSCFSWPDEDTHSLSELSPEYLEAFGKYLIERSHEASQALALEVLND
jgi:hypothetical protein